MHSLDIFELNGSLCPHLSHQHSLGNRVGIEHLADFLPLPGHFHEPLISYRAVLTYGFVPLCLRQVLVEDFLDFLDPLHALPQERLIIGGDLRILLGDVVALGERHAR